MKKIIALVLALVLTVAASVAGTVAYLKDEDSDVNVMTLGNVEIEQHEYQRELNDDGTYKTGTIDEQKSYVLEVFEQGKDLLPIVGDPSTGAAGWDDTPVRMSQVDSYGGMQVFAGANAVDKFVTVENTGKSDAYIRTVVAIEVGSADADLIGTSYHNTWAKESVGEIEIDGNTYHVFVYTYNGAQQSDGSFLRHANGVLPAGDTTYPNLSQVYIKSVATNEDMVALDGNSNGTLDILVLSQAVQTQGFADAKTALDTAFGELNAKNAAEWFGELETPVVVSNAEELTEALEAGKSVVLNGDVELTETVNIEKAANIDLNGHNLTVSVLEAKADTTISNGTVTHGKSTYPALSVSAGTLELDNVDVVCAEYCNLVVGGSGAEAAEYAGIEVWGGKLVLNDSTITVSTDKIRYSNSIFAIGIHAGEVTMNGGSITVTSHGSSRPQYDYQGVIFAGSAGDKTVTLNNVSINIGSGAKYLFAWGGNTTLNTTDTVTAEMVDARNGGTYTIQ